MEPAMASDELVLVQDDGLACSEVGGWTEEKHRLVSLYSTLFSSGTKDKWGKRVYIELYAGPGHSKIRDTSRIIAGSPIRALSVKDPFDKYIFCEENPTYLEALRVRVKGVAPEAKVVYISGDCNKHANDILSETNGTGLSLCFADPFDIGLKFETLRTLSNCRIDFVVLLAVYSDANRAYKRYVMEDAVKVDEFLGSRTWRDRWKIAQDMATSFPKFLAEEFSKSMESLGYLPTPLHAMKRVRKSGEKNLPLYYIALFSRNKLAYKFWDEVLKYSTDQRKFSWG